MSAEPTLWRSELNAMATAYNAWSEQCTAARRATEDLALNIGADTAATWRGLRAASDELESAAQSVRGTAELWDRVLGGAPAGLLTRAARAHDAARAIATNARTWVACVVATPPDMEGAREALKALTVDGGMLTVAGMWLNREDEGTLHEPLLANPRHEREAGAPPSIGPRATVKVRTTESGWSLDGKPLVRRDKNRTHDVRRDNRLGRALEAFARDGLASLSARDVRDLNASLSLSLHGTGKVVRFVDHKKKLSALTTEASSCNLAWEAADNESE